MSQISEEVVKPKKWKKRLQIALWVVGIAAVTVAIAFLLRFLESYFRVPLSQYAPVAYVVVFLVAVLANATVIFPVPGTVIIMAAASKWNPAIVALVAALGSSLGELTGYYAGYLGTRIVLSEQNVAYQRAVSWMNRYGLWAVSLMAFVPLMLFDFVGLVGGALKLPVWKFWLACLAGRIPRSFIEAYVGAGVIPLLFPWWLS